MFEGMLEQLAKKAINSQEDYWNIFIKDSLDIISAKKAINSQEDYWNFSTKKTKRGKEKI